MRETLGRSGGAVAIALSAFWALAATGAVVVGLLLAVRGRRSGDTPNERDFTRFAGGGLAGAGAAVLAAAGAGLLLGRRLYRGQGGAGVIALFAAGAVVSGVFFASTLADESGRHPGSIAAFGTHTAACVAVVLLAVIGG